MGFDRLLRTDSRACCVGSLSAPGGGGQQAVLGRGCRKGISCQEVGTSVLNSPERGGVSSRRSLRKAKVVGAEDGQSPTAVAITGIKGKPSSAQILSSGVTAGLGVAAAPPTAQQVSRASHVAPKLARARLGVGNCKSIFITDTSPLSDLGDIRFPLEISELCNFA